MMLTASIKLDVAQEQLALLEQLRSEYLKACNLLVPIVCNNRCWNRVALHKLSYTKLRSETVLGSQMCCNTIFSVCKSYKALKELGKIKKDKKVPEISFLKGSVHFDKRTYSIKDSFVSLYTLNGRIKVPIILGKHQEKLMSLGKIKEAELVFRKNTWYLNIVIEINDAPAVQNGIVMGIDIGENNLAATSLGHIYGGGQLCHERNKYLALRKRLQSNGSRSAKQKLQKISGKERRHVKHINHETSKAIVKSAMESNVSTIVLEDLTNIRQNIKAGKRIRTRLHRWAFRQLQQFVEYKAKAVGISVQFVNPAYTSQTCANCEELGKRVKHRFVCPNCGIRAHSDLNASRNIARIGAALAASTGAVNLPNVGADFSRLQ
jgi:IS605 OrfB family transposase